MPMRPDWHKSSKMVLDSMGQNESAIHSEQGSLAGRSTYLNLRNLFGYAGIVTRGSDESVRFAKEKGFT